MAVITFFTNPMSRGQVARWALHEVGANYDEVNVPWDNKPAALLEANPLGKVPTIIHHTASGDRVVTEGAAICAYLADSFPEACLAPTEGERANSYRWLFFAAGPLEQGITAHTYGFEPSDPRQRISVGFGELDMCFDMLESHLNANEWVCGNRFTIADVYVGSHVDWGLQFGTFPERAAFKAYAARCQQRDAYKASKAIDYAKIAEIQAKAGEPLSS